MTEQDMQRDIERILTRLDTEIPKAKKEMDELLARLRAPLATNGHDLAPSSEPR